LAKAFPLWPQPSEAFGLFLGRTSRAIEHKSSWERALRPMERKKELAVCGATPGRKTLARAMTIIETGKAKRPQPHRPISADISTAFHDHKINRLECLLP